MKPTVGEIMETETHAVSTEDQILKAIDLLVDKGLTGVPVVGAKGEVLGVLSEEHCLQLVAEGDRSADRPNGKVADFYDAHVPKVSPGMDIYYVAGMFLRERSHRRFPVVEDGKLVGVITRKDILRAVRNRLD